MDNTNNTKSVNGTTSFEQNPPDENVIENSSTDNKTKWGCEIKDVSLERGEDFKLSTGEEPLSLYLHKNIWEAKLPIVGRSGAGKSTFLNILAAVEWPTDGVVSWKFPEEDKPIEWGKDGPSATDAQRLRRKYFGFAFQDSTLMPHLTVADNLCYPLLFNGHSISEAHNKAGQELEKVLLKNEKSDIFLNRFPSQLSGGQRQRISLVQAMIHDPYVLFADEPTGSLDKETRQQVMDVIFNWVKDSSKERMFFWVTHHEDDPGNAGVSHVLNIDSGICSLDPC